MTTNRRRTVKPTGRRSSTKHRPVTKRRSEHKIGGLFGLLFGTRARLAWWTGGILIAVVYVWAFYYFFVGPFGFRWRALYGDANYPGGYEIRGIDISHYQGDIDWDQLQNAMIEKCPIRFIVMKATEGSSKIDPSFKYNFKQALEYGYIRGAYHFGATILRLVSRLISFSTTYLSSREISRQCSMLSTSRKTRAWRISSRTFSHGFISWKTGIM